MPLACIFTRSWLGPGCGCGTSFTCQELLTAGTTAACICGSSMAVRCVNFKRGHIGVNPNAGSKNQTWGRQPGTENNGAGGRFETDSTVLRGGSASWGVGDCAC